MPNYPKKFGQLEETYDFFFSCLGINRSPENLFLGYSKTIWQLGNYFFLPCEFRQIIIKVVFFPFLLKNWGT
jgi:hypothetical protein